jgi:redox-sensitive bicupin YhaK (pirin superfamily)
MPFDIQTTRFSDASHETIVPSDAAATDPFLAIREWGSSDDSGGLRLEGESLPGEFELLNYVLAGALSRRDFAGHETIVRAGGLERLTSAGIAEYGGSPRASFADEAHALRASSMWLRVAPAARPAPPRYQAFEPEQLPVHAFRGRRLRVLAGSFDGARAPLHADQSTFIVHVHLEARADVAFRLEPDATTLVYALDGSAQIGPQPIVAGQLASSREPRSYVALAAQGSTFEALVLSAVAPRGPVLSVVQGGAAHFTSPHLS